MGRKIKKGEDRYGGKKITRKPTKRKQVKLTGQAGKAQDAIRKASRKGNKY